MMSRSTPCSWLTLQLIRMKRFSSTSTAVVVSGSGDSSPAESEVNSPVGDEGTSPAESCCLPIPSGEISEPGDRLSPFTDTSGATLLPGNDAFQADPSAAFSEPEDITFAGTPVGTLLPGDNVFSADPTGALEGLGDIGLPAAGSSAALEGLGDIGLPLTDTPVATLLPGGNALPPGLSPSLMPGLGDVAFPFTNTPVATLKPSDGNFSPVGSSVANTGPGDTAPVSTGTPVGTLMPEENPSSPTNTPAASPGSIDRVLLSVRTTTDTDRVARRQSPDNLGYLNPGGGTVAQCNEAESFLLSNGQLIGDTGPISTSENVASSDFTASSPNDTISTTFEIRGDELFWLNPSFQNGVASFCTRSGVLVGVYNGQPPDNCVPVRIVTLPRKSIS